MVSARNISFFLLLPGWTVAAPRWWTYPGALMTRSTQPQPDPQTVHTMPPGGFVSNGVLWLTTTIYLQPGETPPATTTTTTLQALSGSASQVPAAQPVSQSPAAQPVSQTPAPKPSSQVSHAQASAAPPPPPQISAAASSKPPAPSSRPTTTTPASSAKTPVAAPIKPPGGGTVGISSITPDMIVAIAPTSQSCDGSGKWPDECATAAQAAQAFNKVFSKYNINNAGAQAAVIAWEVFESAEFKYKINHYPGTPGQGTRCMMMPPFVAEYATQLVGAEKVGPVSSDSVKVLALVNGNDEDSFGGCAWYMSAKCGVDVIAKFAGSPDAAWSSFITSCVQTTGTPERDAYWTSAKKALGV